MAEAHEKNGIFTNILEYTVDAFEERKIFRKAEKVHPKKHQKAGIYMAEMNVCPGGIQNIGDIVILDKKVVEYGEHGKDKDLEPLIA